MDILTSFIVIPVLTIIGLIFCKDQKQVKWTAAIGMGIQLILAATLIILFLRERQAGNMAEMLFVKDLVWFPSRVGGTVLVAAMAVTTLTSSNKNIPTNIN